MIRRLFALIILLVAVAAGLYYWKATTGRGPALPRLPRQMTTLKTDLRDATITTAVRSAFALNRSTARLDVKVSTAGGVVTLAGGVPDEGARSAAERVARAVPEVKDVTNQLTLGAGESSADRSLIESLDDEKLELQVKAALSLNRSSRGLPVTVKTFRGVVTLSGNVATREQKELVVAVARETPGVSEVTDAIVVAPQDGSSQPVS